MSFSINKDVIEFANHLADLSQPIARKYFRTDNGEIAKEDDSPVTKADRKIEEIMREEIEKKFPNHGIIGEEYGIKESNSDFTWILDPIDGTSSFIAGRPIFGTLIALSFKGKAILGIMNQPITNERWLGILGQGAWLNGKEIRTRKCSKISDALMCAHSPSIFNEKDIKIFDKISKMTKYQKIGGVVYGGDCYSYASLALGCVDLIIDSGLKIYDYAALQPIIESAGGIITNWQGEDLKLESNVKLIACGDKELHKRVLEILNYTISHS